MTFTHFAIPEDLVSATKVRAFVVDWLRREIVGPAPGHPLQQWDPERRDLRGEEVLRPQDPPRYRYGAGILFPRGVTYSGALDPGEAIEGVESADAVEPERDGAIGEENDDTSPADEVAADEEVAQTSAFLPSTMGISFLADLDGPLRLEVSWATYKPERIPGYGAEPQPGDSPRTLWFRRPSRAILVLEPEELLGQKVSRHTLADSDEGLGLHILSRPRGEGSSCRLLTITLMNTGDAEVSNEACFFQCGFEVHCSDGSRIRPYPDRPDAQADPEELSLQLLYRHRPVFAVGHGCAADWAGREGEAAQSVRTEVLPVFEQAPIAPVDVIPGVDLSMLGLADAPDAELMASCRSLADAYREWISIKRGELDRDILVSQALKDRGHSHLAQCSECLERMSEGISILENDADALEAFRLMNRAMAEQRAHYAISSEATLRRGWKEAGGSYFPERKYDRPSYSLSTAWRPFQLAFVLMNLAPFVHPEGPERDLVDVLWFPTGGGKTEAYLGLSAFTILHRRLVDPENAGTSVLMRYTLRLLTTQQFQRAASLICALELIRRDDPERFGKQPISIGLWLGGTVTPNRNSDAVSDLSKLGQAEGDNRFIVLSCPWCGVDMGPQDVGGRVRIFGYEKVANPAQVRFRCDDPDCPFHTQPGLPLEVVDERIYTSPPTLLIGTVDKFAMLPWQSEARRLFGIDADPAAAPPDLVIQDELHLISGPLGSVVGHYETVIDELCTRTKDGRRIGPKTIASTATIARAEEQVKALYGRSAVLFPPQALRAGDSFFAVENTDVPGRLYVGVLGSALSSHVVAQIRTIAALLQAPALLRPPASKPVPDNVRDPYWTLMGYFNSLRELGRAATLIQADIREYLNAVWDRIGLRADLLGEEAKALRRFINRDEELTSRLRSSDIPLTLQKLFTALPSPETVDLCLATNMIQVGLDVPRLSLMTIVGQPKTASEYIQASSRVGRDRDKPGLVVTNYNPFKPRDRSHFESFRSYHENVYRHVEPTSVTPFSVQVCERAIHALAITLARYRDRRLLGSPQAGVSAQTRQMIRSTIESRLDAVSADQREIALQKLDEFLDLWDRWRPQEYGDFAGTSGIEPLMWPTGKARPDEFWISARTTPSSMRNVDAESEAIQLRQYPAEGES